jgi:predicted HicB family RNase H-like nuclease
MRRQTGFRLTERAHKWLKEQAEERGISKNDVVQEMINKEIERGGRTPDENQQKQ